MQCPALAQGDAHHAPASLLGRFADRLGHLASLAGAVPDPALAVSHHHQRGESEAPATLPPLGNAVDADELLDKFAVLTPPAALTIPRRTIAPPAARTIAGAFAGSRAAGFRGCHVAS